MTLGGREICNGTMICLIATLLFHFGTNSNYAAAEDTITGTLVVSDPAPVEPPKDKVPAPIVQLDLEKSGNGHAVIMDKSTRTLTVWKQDGENLKSVLTVAADFGRNGGDKATAGDLKTPEGIYFFQTMKEGAELNFDEYGVRAFTLDYPNFFDSMNKKGGYGIWLHAIPDSKSLLRGSRGCVVVRNDVIKKISDYISLKRTPIVIQDRVAYLTKDESRLSHQKWQTWVQTWRESWQSKKIDEYIEKYDERFTSLGMNREQWRKYKDNLNKKYEFIRVGVNNPVILFHRDEAVIRFFQDYESNLNSDFGEKTLYLLNASSSSPKIVSEEWRAARKEDIVANQR